MCDPCDPTPLPPREIPMLAALLAMMSRIATRGFLKEALNEPSRPWHATVSPRRVMLLKKARLHPFAPEYMRRDD